MPPEPTPLPFAGIEQVKICSRLCAARCCRYVTVGITPPRSEADWDEVRWWLLHPGIAVYKDGEDGEWAVCFETRCSNLSANNLCKAWPNHPDLCREHDATVCEFREPTPYEVYLTCEDDLARYLEKRRLVRGRRVLEAIRRSRAAGTAVP